MQYLNFKNILLHWKHFNKTVYLDIAYELQQLKIFFFYTNPLNVHIDQFVDFEQDSWDNFCEKPYVIAFKLQNIQMCA